MEVKYSHRCLNDLFGYCAENKEGKPITSTDGNITMTIVTGDCKKDPQKCKGYVTNMVANPYRPELEGKKVYKVKIENGQKNSD